MNDHQTDPEFAERWEHFAFEEVVREEGQQLDEITRRLAILAVLMGCQGLEEFKLAVLRALDGGLSPVMIDRCQGRRACAGVRGPRAAERPVSVLQTGG